MEFKWRKMTKLDISINRIKEMEAILDEALRRMDNAGDSPEALLEYQPEIGRLEAYYSGQEWKEDFALDEKGLLPSDLKRGVLSEDGVFDALERNRELKEDNMASVERTVCFTRDSFNMGDDCMAPNMAKFVWSDKDWCPECEMFRMLEQYLGCNLPGFFWRGYANGTWIVDVNLHRGDNEFSRSIVLSENWRELLRSSLSIHFIHTTYEKRDELPMSIDSPNY